MKTTVRFILLVAVILLSATTAQGKIRKVSEKDSLGNVKRVIELRDTVIDGKSVADTLSIMTYETEEGAAQGDRYAIPGFGTFRLRNRAGQCDVPADNVFDHDKCRNEGARGILH